MSIESDAKYVPRVMWEYWGIISFCKDNPGLYGMEERRTDCHERLCHHYRISKEESREITDHLDQYENAVQVHEALRIKIIPKGK